MKVKWARATSHQLGFQTIFYWRELISTKTRHRTYSNHNKSQKRLSSAQWSVVVETPAVIVEISHFIAAFSCWISHSNWYSEYIAMGESYKFGYWGKTSEELLKNQYPLHRCCRDGDVEALSVLLHEGNHGIYVEDSFYGWTPAHWASYFGKVIGPCFVHIQ